METLNANCLNWLKELVAMRPVSSDVAACNRVSCRLRDILAEQGLFTALEVISGRQILYVSTGPAKTPDYLFSAHLDVVPAIREEQFTPREENGRLYGRGAADCLGNAMAIISALIRANGKTSSGAIFNSDEEIGGATVPVMLEVRLMVMRYTFLFRRSMIIGDTFPPPLARSSMMRASLSSWG